MNGPSIFDQVRAKVAIGDLAERFTKLSGGANQRRGVCPICGSGAKSKSAPFAVYPKTGKWRCWAKCDRSGDAVDLWQELNGGDALEAAKTLLGGDYVAPDRPVQARAEPERAEPSKTGAEMWETGRPLIGSPAERYLLARGIPAALIEASAEALRFHPFAKHSWVEAEGRWLKAPAMVARVIARGGPTGGYHATYLKRTEPARDKRLGKKMWGPQSLDGRHGCVWLIGPGDDGDLVVAEGIETAYSTAALVRPSQPVRICAALSLDRLQGGIQRDREGRINVFDPQPDPERPAFTWPVRDEGLGPGLDLVVIGVDRDMSPAKVRAYNGRGKPCDFELDAEARARLCARLAVRAWRDAGWKASAIAPPPLLDFNDQLRRVAARSEAA